MKHFYKDFVIVTLITFVTVCSSDKSETLKKMSIPEDVKYSIISQDTIPGIKRSLDIRINKKVSKEVLESIAYDLRDSDKQSYEKTFILYYLPDMKVDAGAWASTHFTPELKVNVFGLTSEEEKALVESSADSSWDIIGEWMDDRPFANRKITIYVENDQIYMKTVYKDASSSTDDMIEKKSTRGRRFEEKEGSSFDEHYLINKSGDLEMWDSEGLIYTAKKLKK